MLYSMTGFGKGTAECEGGTVTVEIKTVNSKSLDLSIKLPRELFAFEADVKKAVQSGVTRGKTDVFVQFARSENAATAVKVDWALAEAYIKAGKEASERLNIDWKTDVDRLFKIPDVITVERPEPDAEALGACVRRAAAEAVLFLCSDKAGFITGENVCVDGGMTRLMIYHGEHGWTYAE